MRIELNKVEFTDIKLQTFSVILKENGIDMTDSGGT